MLKKIGKTFFNHKARRIIMKVVVLVAAIVLVGSSLAPIFLSSGR